MIAWSDIDDIITKTLNDTTYSLYPLQLRLDASNWALSMIAWYKPVQSSITIPSGSREISYPDDLIEVVAVWDSTNWCAPINFGTDSLGSMVKPGQDNVIYDRSFWLYGSKVNLTNSLSADGILFYHARYDMLTDISDIIDIPSFLFQPLVYLSVAFCLQQNIAQQGVLSVWQETGETGLTEARLSDTYQFYIKSAIEILQALPMKHEELSLVAIRRREYVQK